MLNGVALVMTFVLKSFAIRKAEVAQRKIKSDAAFFIFVPTRQNLVAVFFEADETIASTSSARGLNIRGTGNDNTVYDVRGIRGHIDERCAQYCHPCGTRVCANLEDASIGT